MHSPAAVALTPRLAAILRLDMPAADSLSTSLILCMGNLGPGMPRSLWKRSEAMPIRRSPNGARHPRPQAIATARNRWSRSVGMSGRDQSESLVAISRCAHPFGVGFIDVPLHDFGCGLIDSRLVSL